VTITFETTERGLVVEDDIERRRHELETDGAGARRVDVDRLYFPVDAAVAVPTDELTFPTVVATYVRDADGEMLGEIDQFGGRSFEAGRYSVELCASIKFYLRVDGRLEIDTSDNRMRIATDADEIVVGARSHHERPEATITTTGEPHDLMAAVTALSSALKTTSPERSYPTLRGHPPTIELGDELHVPDALEVPETGITLELPPSRRYVYPAASLAYYLGARVVPGPSPRLVTDEGFEHRLDGPDGYEAAVERALKRAFFLDCLTRTEGYYTVDLHERAAVEPELDLEFAALYDASPAERLEAYLGVPFATVEDHLPEWKLTTHVDTDPEQAELLPFLVRDLATIRLPEGESVADAGEQSAAVSEFTRSASGGTAAAQPSTFVQPSAADSVEQAWAGEDVPVGASKASVQAFRNRLERDVSDGDIDIAVVCNDDAMGEERSAAEEVYGSREELPFDIHVYHDLSTAALRAVVETDVDFLHYIGHIDEEGFDCADGKLDARDLEFVGVDAFLLNACGSYEQGMALIDRGAIGGVVTLSEVNNSGAVRVGRAMSRLLNQGFPLRAALDIAKDRSIVGGQYIVVGDGNVDVVQLETSQPMLPRIDSLGGDRFDVTFRAYPTESRNMGTMTTLLVDEGTHYLGSGDMGPFTLDREDLWQVVGQESVPLLVDGEFTWSDEVDLTEL
jgi:hypothetical protein